MRPRGCGTWPRGQRRRCCGVTNTWSTAPCSTPAQGDIGLIKVYSTDESIGADGIGRVCFQVQSTPAQLTLRVPDVYEIRGDGLRTGTGHALTAQLTDAAGAQKSVAVDADGSTGVGIGADPDASPTTLLKLVVTG